MAIRFIALDLDDTLLDDRGKIPAPAAEAIREAREAGILVTIATGRMFCATRSYARELALDLPLICYQGALIQHHDAERPLACLSLAPQPGRQLLQRLRELEVYYHGYFGDDLYVESITPENKEYARHIGVELRQADYLGDLMEDLPVMEIMAVPEPGRMEAVEADLRERFGQHFHFTRFRDIVLEFMHPQAGKDKALQSLSAQYGIKRHEVMAIGDGHNDITMLQWAGLGVAMDNAEAEVKAAADRVCPSNREAGVASAIRWAMNNA